MQRRGWLAVLMVAVLAGPAAAGRQRGRRGGRQPEVSFVEQLVRECKLTAKQQADLKAKLAAREAALAAWDKANAEKLKAAQAAAREARSGGDADARKKAFAEVRELQTARKESAAEATAAVLAGLTAEQKAAWAGYQLYRPLEARYRKAELTEQQQAKIKAGCALAAKELSKLDEGDERKANRARRAVTDKLRWGIEAFVLTPEQRETIPKRPTGRRGRSKDTPAPAGAGG